MILVTGAEGLIGRHICAVLEAAGVEHRPFDLKRSPAEDIRDTRAMVDALRGIRGVVHLAAVSRVIWGERDPERCESVNVHALHRLLHSCVQGDRPWFIFASSREVYGQTDSFPVREDAHQIPLNTYARSKQRGEMLVEEAAAAGLHANICRFSSVYGCPHDHPDRVAMAFALAAAGRQDQISIEGANNTFDFTAIRDIADGLWRLIEATDAGESLPPIHFVSGHGTTLGDLAQLAVKLSSKDITVGQAPPRSFDVSRFVGDPSRARSLIVWTAKTDLRTGFEQLVRDLAQAARHPAAAEPM